MIVISMTAVQVVTNLNALARLFKSFVYTVALTVHLFIQCFMSQQIVDSSLLAKQSLMNAKWYLARKPTKQLLHFMIMRSHVPCQLTAGKIMLMSLNTFSSVIRTSATYFTVFLDMQ
ncbi:odorant receptor 82a-like [Fopius arisanus]|uniref:Odorant receptor 82a-like n=1 Tax=Fopius arisanus TaxID=64838 RepID=A0A9R1TAK7_9HYME|nr:PREDICTED: odorant receptor 82a-like [Fopius arisanus]